MAAGNASHFMSGVIVKNGEAFFIWNKIIVKIVEVRAGWVRKVFGLDCALSFITVTYPLYN